MFGALVVNDPTRRQRQVTTLMMALPGVIGVAASIALSDHKSLRLAAFFLVTFLAIALRRFGVRWFALGFVGFMMFFMPLFFPVHVEALGAAAVSVLAGTAIAYAFRFWIFPDRPKRLLKLYLESFEIRLRELVDELDEALRQWGEGRRDHREKASLNLQGQVRGLNELVLTIETFLRNDSLLAKAEIESLQMRLFERELAVRDLLESARGLTQMEISKVGPALTALRGEISRVRAGSLEGISLTTDDDGPELPKTTGPVSAPVGMHLTTRQAIQATIATAIASLLGAGVSPDRWYWASMTAFVVFTGASRGDTAMRAFLRIGGTVMGLMAGFAVARLVSGHGLLETILISLTVFLGLYNSRRAFGFWTAMLFSLMVVFLFDVMGAMSTSILLLRLEETAVGAVVGAIVSASVLPTSTRSTVRAGLAKLLVTASEVLRELPLAAERRRVLVGHLRRMDQDLLALRTSASPLVDVGGFLDRGGGVAETLFDASAMVHLVKNLATDRELARTQTEDQLRFWCLELSGRLARVSRDLDKSSRAEPLQSRARQDLPPAVHRLEQVVRSLEERSF
ncbi:MAG: FUSC family protein [Bdellovibrionaceae bacterium]|nr:FUSC family protein [Pseudobdellovibrionaceae bacterium]